MNLQRSLEMQSKNFSRQKLSLVTLSLPACWAVYSIAQIPERIINLKTSKVTFSPGEHSLHENVLCNSLLSPPFPTTVDRMSWVWQKLFVLGHSSFHVADLLCD